MRPVEFALDTCLTVCTRRHLRVEPLAVAFLVVLFSLPVSVSFGQRRQIIRQPNQLIRRTPLASGPSVLIEPSAPIANLLDSAREGADRGDWKFVIDCLQRVIDDPDSSLVALDTEGGSTSWTLFETARRSAMRQLSALPTEGLRAYRLLFDGKAKRLLEQGREHGDIDALREVVNRYLLTSYGDEAADTLASYALDDGRTGEVITTLTSVLQLVPDRDVSEALLDAKLAVAYAMQGRMDRASDILDSFDRKRGRPTGESLKTIVPSVDTLRPLAPALLGAMEEPRNWPTRGGSSSRRSRMAAVVPTLLDDVPWKFVIDNNGGDSWRRVFADDPSTSLWIPMLHPVAREGTLFVRTSTGCAALAMEDLSVLWEVQEPGNTVLTTQSPADGPQAVLHALAQAAEYNDEDYLTSAVSLGPGIVLTVSRTGENTYAHADKDQTETIAPPAPVTNIRGTRIIAYDQRTGNVVWQRGRTVDPSDPLASVTFQSAPLAIGRELWVSFFRGNDFYLGILDPQNGALVQQMLLCSIRGAARSHDGGLPVTSADGLVYVPSGHGVLFAVDAADHTLRWATQYAASVLRRNALVPSDEPSSWLPSAPIAAGGLVLIAPRESEELFALAGETGVPKWSKNFGENRYTIAADGDSIWIGGRTIERIALSNGDVLWNTAIPASPTGAAVLSGDRLLVPVLDGLITLDAATGKAVSYVESPASGGPLGNLLCLDTSMYAVNPSEVRKFPDLARSYERTQQAYTLDSSDMVTAIRMVWLELLRDQPQRAFDILRQLPDRLFNQADRLADQAAHVKVEVLLALARRSDQKDASVIQHLEMARAAAQRPDDQVRCELAIGDALCAAGQVEEAYRHFWRLGVGDRADRPIQLSAQTTATVRFEAAERLRRIDPQLTEAQRRSIQKSLNEDAPTGAAVDVALSGAGTDAHSSLSSAATRYLTAVADMVGDRKDGQAAMFALGSYYLAQDRHEIADWFLRQAITAGTDSDLTLSSVLALSDLYARESYAGADATGLLVSNLDLARQRFADRQVPDKFLTPGNTHRRLRVADWAKQQLNRIGAARLAAFRGIAPTTRLELEEAPMWSVTWPANDPAGMVHFGDTVPPVLAERVILQHPNNTLSCHDSFTGEMLWEAELRKPESFDNLSEIPRRFDPFSRRYATADGQIGVFAGDEGLFAVGLLTGRRLWFFPYDLAGEVHGPARRDQLMAAGDGLLAASPKSGRLSLLRLRDGSVVWERDLREEPVDRMWMVGDRIVTVGPKRERVNIFNRANGDRIGRVEFKQPDSDSPPLSLVITAGRICGPLSNLEGDFVTGYDLKDAKPAWRVEVDRPPVEIFDVNPADAYPGNGGSSKNALAVGRQKSPQDGLVAVGLFGGDIRIIDAASGDVMPNRHLSRTHKVYDGVLVDGTLVLQHVATRDKVRVAKLAAIDLVTGAELWQKDDVVSLSLVHDPLRVIGGCIPAVLAPRERRNVVPTEMVMLDVRTGEMIGKPVSPPPLRNSGKLTGDFSILPTGKVMVVETKQGIFALSLKSATPSQDGGL